jgi:hypothetical protein
MPVALYQKIKVKPPAPKLYSNHTHVIDEPCMRLENAKNYSPIVSIIEARQNKGKKYVSHSQELPDLHESAPKAVFRERQVEFLVEQRNQNKVTDSEDITNIMYNQTKYSMMNMTSSYDPDPRTVRIINRMLEKGDVNEDQSTLEGAFFDYVFYLIEVREHNQIMFSQRFRAGMDC